MQQPIRRQQGFTLIEILLIVGVIGILGAIATVGYQEYQSRARASDIVLKYDAIRSGLGSLASNATEADCTQQARAFSNANLQNDYAQLGYGFQPTTGGFRPVLTVCARADATGNLGVKVAKGAMDTLARTGSVEPGALVSDSVVSFALPLTAGDKATCTAYTPTTAPVSPCNVTIASSATACPAGKESFVIPGSGRAACLPSCQPGQTRDQSANCVGTSSGSVPGATPAVVPPVPGSPAAQRLAADPAKTMTTLASMAPLSVETLRNPPEVPKGCTVGQVVDANGACRDLVCHEEVIPAPPMGTLNTAYLGMYPDLGSGGGPGDFPPIPPRSLWREGGLSAKGSDCLLCGDPSSGQPCSDFDIMVGMTIKCPDTQPVCRNDIMVRGGQPVEFRNCVSIHDALYINNAKSDCLPGLYATPNREGAICSRTSYGDGSNLWLAGVSFEGSKRLVCQ